jgi:pimeloyl-ACP methyl ester carboxylesterase
MRRAPLLLAAALLALLAVPARARSDSACIDRTGPQPYTVGSESGFVSYPSKRPKALVVFFHGYGHDAADWAVHHLERVAEENRAVTVAMDYPGQSETATWQVREGAEASVAAARALKQRCKPDQTVAYGVSMGANASGIALASAPGIFDWWVAVEGAHNVIETYVEARALSDVNAYAASARKGIELEMGGPIETHADAYRAHTNVLLAEQIEASGIEGVVMVHGVGDGLVPYDQSREMAAALAGTRIDFTTVLTRVPEDDDETAGTTADEHVTKALGIEDAVTPSPFAGHANENSETHLVGRRGFERLRDLLAGEVEFREHVLDGHGVDTQQQVP